MLRIYISMAFWLIPALVRVTGVVPVWHVQIVQIKRMKCKIFVCVTCPVKIKIPFKHLLHRKGPAQFFSYRLRL